MKWEFEELKSIVTDAYVDSCELIHECEVTRSYGLGMLDGIRRIIALIGCQEIEPEKFEEILKYIDELVNTICNGTSKTRYLEFKKEESPFTFTGGFSEEFF